MTIVVATAGWSPSEWIDGLHAIDPARDVRAPEAVTDPAAVDYALVWKPEPGYLAGLPNLKVIFSLGAGVDHLTSDPALPDLPVVRIVDPDLTRRMTEWVVLQVLLHHRQQRAYDAQQQVKTWKSLRQWSAAEVRVGIMGLGVLGLDAARALTSFGFPVAAWSRSPKTEPGIDCYSGEAGLAPFLTRTDILVVLLPLTNDTRGILNARLVDGLAKDGPLGGPVIINAGRGGLQVEDDLVAALKDGRLAGASLDVFVTEPLPAASPLWHAPNLTLTPHVAAESDPKALCRYVLGQIEAFERGEPLQNLVDRARGY